MLKQIVHIVKITGIHGTEKHLLDLLPGLTRDYRLTVILLAEPGCPMDNYIAALHGHAIETYRINIRRDMDPRCFVQLYSLLKKMQPALVHTHLIHGDLYGITAARLAGIRTIVSTKHNDDTFRKNAVLNLLNRFVNKRLNRAIAISHWIKAFICDVEKMPPDRIETIHYGLPAPPAPNNPAAVRTELGYSPELLVLGIIARLVEQKGHSCLIEAFAEAHARNPRIRLLIVGDGPLNSTLKDLVRMHQLSGVIRFTGYRTDITELLAAIDIFIHPSLWEGFGLAILEAMAAAKPIISSRVSAIPELIEDRVSGLLVPPGSSSELAQAITRLCSDSNLRSDLGLNAARRWQEHFSLEPMVRKTGAFYESILKTQE
ncbi:MAG: glycosyltransferase [Deltaproteobacteria bacterium]|nr:glycosyltransferase [Deltaproteobacteria bacterium]